jgi:hypothetical protein
MEEWERPDPSIALEEWQRSNASIALEKVSSLRQAK